MMFCGLRNCSKFVQNFSCISGYFIPEWFPPQKIKAEISALYWPMNRIEEAKKIFFLIIFGRHKFFLWRQWLISLFRLLVMSPFGFKVRVGSHICTWQRHTCDTFPENLLCCDTCQPHGSQTDLSHVPVTRQRWSSKPGPKFDWARLGY